MKLFKKTLFILIIILFILSVFAFIYALGFFTNLVPTQDPYPEFFQKAQEFNHFLFNASFYLLLVMGLNLALSLKNKNLSMTKCFLLSVTSIIIIVISGLMITRLKEIKTLYLSLDFTNPNFLIFTPGGYEPSNLLFIFGYFLSYALILTGVVTEINLLYLVFRKIGKCDEYQI